MDNELVVRNWHRAIIQDCERILGRGLTDTELEFIIKRGGFIALELIHDHVKSLETQPEDLISYLNPEAY